MNLIKSILFFLLIGCSNTSQEDIFELARHGKSTEIEKLITKDNTLINQKNKSGFTPLTLACYNGNKEIIPFLLDKGAEINTLSDMGTALMAASYKGNNDIVKILIEKGANVNIADDKGVTALHYACFQQNIKLVKLLVNNHAKMNTKDRKGKTPLDYAIENNNIKIIKILQP